MSSSSNQHDKQLVWLKNELNISILKTDEKTNML